PGGGPLADAPEVNRFQGQVAPELRLKAWDLEHFSSFRFMHMYPKMRQLSGPLIENLPLSESRSLQKFPGSSWNYLDWLSQSAVDQLWKEQFQSVPIKRRSPAPIPPRALLYHFSRFALRR